MKNFDYPKIKANLKLTAVPKSLIADIETELASTYYKYLKDNEKIHVFGELNKEAAYLRAVVGTEAKGEVFDLFLNDAEGLKMGLDGILGLLLDFLNSILKEYFEEERDARMPLDYTPFTFQNRTILGNQEFRNFELEAQADAILNKSE